MVRHPRHLQFCHLNFPQPSIQILPAHILLTGVPNMDQPMPTLLDYRQTLLNMYESLAQQLQEINERLAAIEKRIEQPAVTVSVKETANMLGVSVPKVYELMHRADFPMFKVGSRVLISAVGLQEWVKAQVAAQ